jgi:hypothetical protein
MPWTGRPKERHGQIAMPHEGHRRRTGGRHRQVAVGLAGSAVLQAVRRFLVIGPVGGVMHSG